MVLDLVKDATIYDFYNFQSNSHIQWKDEYHEHALCVNSSPPQPKLMQKQQKNNVTIEVE